MSASQYPGWIQLIISLWDQYWLWIIKGAFHAWSKHRIRMAEAKARIAKHQRKMEAQYRDVPRIDLPPGAGPCKHRTQVLPAFNTVIGEREAWYCMTCYTQLPKEYAIEAENL